VADEQAMMPSLPFPGETVQIEIDISPVSLLLFERALMLCAI